MPQKTTVIFDMDGVVIDSERLYDLTDMELLGRRNLAYEREKIVSLVMGKNFREGTTILKEIHGLTEDVDFLMNERHELLEEHYRNSLRYIPGFEQFHASLKTQGMQTCIATSSGDNLLNIADEKLGLFSFFGKNIFKVSDVGNISKPNPDIFLYAADQFQSEPGQCIVIEDSPNGILAAKNANMYCIGITTTHSREQLNLADVVVDDFGQIDLINEPTLVPVVTRINSARVS